MTWEQPTIFLALLSKSILQPAKNNRQIYL
jgi:hypothetical protein